MTNRKIDGTNYCIKVFLLGLHDLEKTLHHALSVVSRKLLKFFDVFSSVWNGCVGEEVYLLLSKSKRRHFGSPNASNQTRNNVFRSLDIPCVGQERPS